jgi:2-succinyl-5-enolpyruvyl-6-hydroxy-3-cyclohexene-1-carboxylate synthase
MACAADDRLRVRVHLDERSCGFFALGVGKATGRPAAVVTTSGTAVANLYPAVVEAGQAGVPLIVLSADRPLRLRGADANQAIDQVRIFGTYPRAFFNLPEPSLDPRTLQHVRGVAARAWASACGHGAGPVHINVPFDKPLEPEDPPGEVAVERIEMARPTATDEQLHGVLASLADRSGVIVAGPTEEAGCLGPEVRAFAATSGFPLLADPLSGARFGTGDGVLAVAAYDLFLRDEAVRSALAPEVIVRVGASPTSAALQRWLFQYAHVPQVVIDDAPRWKDHGGTATTYLAADAADTLERLTAAWPSVERSASGAFSSFTAAWVRADTAARDALARLGPEGLGEGGVAASALRGLPDGAALVVSSSMPIRDLDAFAVPTAARVLLFGNRGASGIDGVISTAFGIASKHPQGPTVLVIGDVAFFHDQNGLLWARESDAPLVIVLVDNDGGAIFGMLPIAEHEPEFTTYFTTPHGIDFSHAAAEHGIRFDEVSTEGVEAAVSSAVVAGETSVIHVRTDGPEGHRLRAEVRDEVVRNVRAALA